MTETTRLPYSPAHLWLIEMGYELHQYGEEWYDGGDAENGPKLEGNFAYDQYTGTDERIYVSEQGVVLEREPYDAVMEAAFAEWDAEAIAELSADFNAKNGEVVL